MTATSPIGPGFGAPTRLSFGDPQTIGDIDGDGRRDLVIALPKTNTNVPSGLQVNRNTASGWTALPPVFGDVAYPAMLGLASADLNTDGHADVVALVEAANSPYHLGIQVFLGDASGGLTPQAVIGLTSTPTSAAGSMGPATLALADFDRDGNLDVAYVTSNGVQMLAGNGTGGFSSTAQTVLTISLAASPYGIAVGDIDGDGRPDVAVGDRYLDSTRTNSAIHIALDRSTGWVSRDVTVGITPYSVAIGDVNGDAANDLVVTASGGTYLLLNAKDGAGTLGAPSTIASDSYWDARLADIDGNGALDLVAVSGDDLLVRAGSGTGTFAAPRWSATGAQAIAGIVDLNGDGLPDVVTFSNASSATMVWPSSSAPVESLAVSPAPRVNIARSIPLGISALNSAADTRSVQWSVTGGGSVNSGSYTAPGSPPAGPVTVTGTLAADTTKSASAAVTVTNVNFHATALTSQWIRDLAFDPVNSSLIYAAAYDGIHVTRDGGFTWSLFGTGLGAANHIVRLVQTSTHTYLFTNGGQLMRYDVTAAPDGSGAWQAVGAFGLAIDTLGPFATAGATVYAVGSSSLYKSTDAGTTWTSLGRTATRVFTQTASIVWIVDGSHLLRSTDGGATWAQRDAGIPNPPCAVGVFCGPTPSAIYTLAFDPTSSDHVIAAGDYFGAARGAFRTTDGGATWTILDALPLQRVSRLAVDPTAPSTIYAIGRLADNTGLVMKTVDGGASWWDITTDLPASSGNLLVAPAHVAVDPHAPNDVLVGLQDGLYATSLSSSAGTAVPSGIAIAPPMTSVALGASATFTATVSGLSNTSVQWSVVSGGGSITSGGVYTAPLTFPPQGTAVVRAVSIGDPTRSAQATIALVPGHGGGGFAPRTPLVSGAVTALGDLNGDGRVDFVRVLSERTNAYIQDAMQVALNTASGWVDLPRVYVDSGYQSVVGLAVGDFDGDGHLDVLADLESSNAPYLSALELFRGDGTGALVATPVQPGTSTPTAGSSFGGEALAVADVDGDGHLDAITLTSSGAEVRRGDGAGAFGAAAGIMRTLGIEPLGVAVGDLNGDGRPDVVFGDIYSDGTGTNQSIHVVLNGGGGVWSDQDIVVSSQPRSVAIGDLNEDGHPDLVVAAGRPYVLLGDGTGAFGVPTVIGPDTLGVNDVALGHLNADAHLDVVGAGSGVIVLPGNGDGTVGTPSWSYAGDVPLLTGLADLTGDGRVDVLTRGAAAYVYANVDAPVFAMSLTPDPARVNIAPGQTIGFGRIVANASFDPTGINWTLAGPGIISAWNGTYTPPSQLPAAGTTITVTGTITTDPAQHSASTQVTLDGFKFQNTTLVSQYARDVVFDPVDPLRMYVAAYDGVHLTTDGGRTWPMLGTGLGTGNFTIALAQSGSSSNLIANSGLHPMRYDLAAAPDGSGAWQTVTSITMGVDTVAPIASFGATVYVATGTALYKSTDAGVTWTSLGHSAARVWTQSASTVWIVDANKLLRSTDGGATWSERDSGMVSYPCALGQSMCGPTPGSIFTIAFDPTDPQRIYVGADDFGATFAMYTTTDGGASWQIIGKTFFTRVSSITIDPSDPATVYALVQTPWDRGVWRSLDHGSTWTNETNGIAIGTNIAIGNSFIAVDPFFTDGVFVGLTDGLHATALPPLPVPVGTPSGISISPPMKSVALGASATFTATVSGLTDTTVQWSVVSGGGSITGAGVYTAPVTFPAQGTAVVRAVSNGDPTRSAQATIALVPGHGGGGFGPRTAIAGGWNQVAVDLNGDGHPDLVQVMNATNAFSPSCLLVRLADGSGGWQLPRRPVCLNGAYGPGAVIAAGDFNGDGHMDVVAVLTQSASPYRLGLQVALGDGSGGLVPQPTVALTDPSSSASSFAGGPAMVTADFDGDGHLDVAFASAGGVGIAYGNGVGGFTLPVVNVYANASSTPLGLAVGDLDGDGRPDLVFGDIYSDGSGSNQNVHVVLNGGNDVWIDQDIAVGAQPRSVAIGDLNEDGHPDLVVVASGRPYVLLGDGTGAFSAPSAIGPSTLTMYEVAVGHLNGDAHLDVVGAGSGVVVLPGNGDATFGTPSWSYAGDVPGLTAVADLTGDGRVDVLTRGGGSTYLYPNVDAPVFAMSLTPNPARVNSGQALGFDRIVANASFDPTGITWSLAGPGSLSWNGTYTPPWQPPAPGTTITVTGTISTDPALHSASAPVTLSNVAFTWAGLWSSWVESFAFDPDNAMRIYAIAFDGAHVSDDGGTTWSSFGTGLLGNQNARLGLVVASNGHKYLFATTAQVMRYDITAKPDGSGAWQAVSGITLGSDRIAPIAIAGATVSVATGTALYRSTDAGATWTNVGRAAQRVFTSDGTDLWIVDATGLWHSTDGGATWAERDAGFAWPTQVLSLAIDPADHNRIFAAGDDGNLEGGGGVFMTTDGGVHWTLLFSAGMYRAGTVVMDPSDHMRMYALGEVRGVGRALYETVDGGASWWNVTNGFPTTGGAIALGPATIAVHPLSPSSLYLGLSQYAYYTGVPSTQTTPVLTWSTPAPIVYGTPLGSSQLSATATDATSGATVAGTFTYTPAAGTILHPGTHSLSATFTPTDTTHYTSATVSTQITVNTAPLTVTAASASKTYGTANPSLTATVDGFVNGDSLASLGGSLAIATTAVDASPVGTYQITASGLTSSDYSISFVAGTLTVTPAPATVLANDASKLYGQADPPLTATVTGLVGADTLAYTLATTATASSPAGSYPITVALGSNPNYTVTTVAGTLSVTSVGLTVTAEDSNKVYGTANPAFSATFSGFANGDTAASLAGTLVFTTTATAASPVGHYAVTPGGLSSPNYTITYQAGDLLVTAAALTIAAHDQTKTYGDTLTFSGSELTATGLLNGDAVASATLTSAGATATASVAAGPYPIVASAAVGTGLGNYTITYVNGSLTVTKATLDVRATDAARTYGDANPSLSATFTGFRNGESLATSGVTGSPALATTAGVTSAVGTYPITAAIGSLAASNYTFTFASGTLSVAQRPITVTADAQTKTYGDPDPALSYQTSAPLVAGDSFGGALARDAGEHVGRYAITQGTLALSANYALTFVGADLAITPRRASVSPAAATKVYGGVDPTLTGTLSGFLPSDGVSATYTRTAGEHVVGSYVISATLSPASALSDYTITYDTAAFTITPAPLTISGSSDTKVYGTLDGVTPTYAGFVNGDTPSALATLPVCGSLGTAATATVAGSPYATSCAGASSSDYNIGYATGTIVVTPRPLTIVANDQAKTYGDAFVFTGAEFTTSAGGLVNADAVTSVTLTSNATDRHATVAASPYPIVPSAAAGSGLANYAVTYANGSFSVRPFTPVLTWPAPAPMLIGTPLSSTQLDATASGPFGDLSAQGTFTYAPPAGTIVSSGAPITATVTFVPSDAIDYTTASTTTVISVLGPRPEIRAVRAALAAAVGSGGRLETDSDLAEAIRRLLDADRDLYWVDDSTLTARGVVVFDDTKAAAVMLREHDRSEHARVGISAAMALASIRELIASDRAIASIAIDAAVAANGDARLIAEAQRELVRGDALGADPNAIDRYRSAWQKARDALRTDRAAATAR